MDWRNRKPFARKKIVRPFSGPLILTLNGILLVFLVLLFSTQFNSQWKQPVALQPFDKIDPQLPQQVVNGIKKSFCKVEVDIKIRLL